MFNPRFHSNVFSNQVFLVSCWSTCHHFQIIINNLLGFFSDLILPGVCLVASQCGSSPSKIISHFSIPYLMLLLSKVRSLESIFWLLLFFNILTKRKWFCCSKCSSSFVWLVIFDSFKALDEIVSAFSAITFSLNFSCTFLVHGLSEIAAIISAFFSTVSGRLFLACSMGHFLAILSRNGILVTLISAPSN